MNNYYLLGLLFKKLNMLDQALEYFEISADEGNLESMYELGRLLHYGDAQTIDRTRSMKYLTKGAESGHVKAQHFLGNDNYTLFHGIDTAHKWLMMASDQGYHDSTFLLGSTFQRHRHPKIFNMTKAAYWFKIGTDGGHEACSGSYKVYNMDQYKSEVDNTDIDELRSC